MALYNKFIENVKLRRIVVLFLVLAALYLVRHMITMIFLTFIFTFLGYKFEQKIKKYIKIPPVILTTLIYSFILAAVYFALTRYVPVLVNQSVQMVTSLVDFYEQEPKNADSFFRFIHNSMQQFDILDNLQNGATLILSYVQNFGKIAFAVVMSFILSFFFLIEEKRTVQFSRLFLKGELSWFFQDVHYFMRKFADTFGVVIEAQFIIALVNTFLTTLSLFFLGFTQLPSLAIMVFILSLIPVAGVIISLIPLSFIAYSQGGIHDVIMIVIIVIVIHLIESYLLNPKLMSSKTELPIFYTFVILLFSEHYFGVWGLVMGVPVFVFILDLLKVKSISRVKKLPKKTES